MRQALSPSESLREAVQIAGSQSAFARLLGVSQASVWAWLNDCKPLPTGPVVPAGELNWVLKAEHETGVSRHDLRPDLYPRDLAAPAIAQVRDAAPASLQADR